MGGVAKAGSDSRNVAYGYLHGSAVNKKNMSDVEYGGCKDRVERQGAYLKATETRARKQCRTRR